MAVVARRVNTLGSIDQTASSSTASSLIGQVQANDREAWSRLARLYTPMAVGWCRNAGLQDADIGDLVQNVFTSVYRRIGQFQRNGKPGAFRAWLWTITRHEVCSHFRRVAKETQAKGGTDAHLALAQLPEAFSSDTAPQAPNEQSQLVRRALREIKPEFEPTTWQAFWRTTIDQQSAPSVAEELGISPGAVRQAKYRVLLRLRNFLADD